MLWQLLQSAFRQRTDTDSLIERGLALRMQGRLPDAEQVLREAVRLAPRDAIAATNLGMVLLEQNQAQQGIDFLQQALECDPRCAAAHHNLANVLRSMGRLPEAAASYRTASNLDPQLPSAREELMHTLLEVCDWEAAATEADMLRELVARRPPAEWMPLVSPLTSSYLRLETAQRKQVAAYHAAKIAYGIPFARRKAAPADGARERIRLGYLSRDFRDHPVGHLLRNAFAHHDRGRVEVYAFSLGPDDGSEYRASIAASVDHFVDAGRRTDAQLADAIAAAGIDVLIDLMGHTTGNRLGILARRPAPVQAHYLGYPGTTGAAYLDYFVTDEIATPPGLAAEFTEELVYLPHCFMVTDGEDASRLRPAARAEHGLPEGAFVYCNFANSSRITREVFRLWMEILACVPSSVLWLKQSHESTVQNLRLAARRAGVDPERLIFASRVADKPRHLERLGLADLALDTIGWHNGHTSTSDVLWAGVPVLTAPGTTFASRVAASLLHASGMPEMVARDAREYVAMAIRLGEDRGRSPVLKRALAGHKLTAPFFDARMTVHDLEQACFDMCAAARARSSSAQ